MNRNEAKKRIEKLKKVIQHHRYLYHVLDREEISQGALDSLKHELYKLEEQFPEFITPDSPTQRVAGKPLKGFKKVEHKLPMLSIEDIFSEKELQDWENYLKRLAPGSKLEYFCEPKVDGFGVSLIYKNGIFSLGSTRGSGLVGEDVTQNLKTLESIPLRLRRSDLWKKLDLLEIRGEVYMEKKDFEKLNASLKKKGEKTYANPRNLAAGSIRQLDPKLAASRPLKFLAYDLVSDLGQKKHSEEHQILKELGFKAEEGKICQNLSEVVEFWRKIAKKREILPYQIDGVVVAVNDNSLFNRLGVAGKSPRGIRAFKFSPKQATTRILNIIFQVGRTGAVTPVAVLRPVEVGGVTISRATLHNEDEMKKLGAKIGDTVIVERAGDVIPAVVRVLTSLRSSKEKTVHFPKKCPVCQTELQKPEGEAIWRCPNADCGARKREFLHHFASKKAFDIEGLGPKIIDQLVDEGLISNVSDLFELKEGDLIPLERFAEKSARNLVEAIQKSKRVSLARFIYALGIRHVGEETAIDLAQHFGSIERLAEAKKEELMAIPNIGNVAAESIYSWFRSPQNRRLIEGLKKAGVVIIAPPKIGKKLKGKIFVLTGTLQSLTRSEAEKKIRILGGHPASSVSKNTDFLVVGKEPGTKLEKAKKLGVKIIGEEEFLEMIK
jgi:DNA ligase (NAD+)